MGSNDNDFNLQFQQLSVVWENFGRQVLYLIVWQTSNEKNIKVSSKSRVVSVIYLRLLTGEASSNKSCSECSLKRLSVEGVKKMV